MFSLEEGVQSRLHTSKGATASYSYSLQSTALATLERMVTIEAVGALGAIEHEEKPGILRLFERDQQYKDYDIAEALWCPLTKKLTKLPYYIKLMLSANKVTEAEVFEGEVAEI